MAHKKKFSLDFKQLENEISGPAPIEPRKIFSTLNRNPRFKRPTDEQGEVLDKWFKARSQSDNTLKMNTGAGKTLVGLLILQSCLNEEIAPAVYITPDNYLAEQAKAEAKSLGISVTDNEDDPEFLNGSAVLIINVKKLINGRSKFGIGSEKIHIGALVVDDAHACLATVADQFSLKIPRKHDAYGKLFELFKSDLEKQSYSGTLDLQAEDPHSLMAVPYWAWQDRRQEVINILHTHRADRELMWAWPLLSSVIPLCECAFGPDFLEIAPKCLPIDVIPAFTRASRKIYMTATLADDGILVTHFGADADSIRSPIKPEGAGDIGDRMILAPQEITPGITTDEIKKLAGKIAQKRNVVVIVPSKRKAEYWKDVATQVLDKENIAKGVEALKKGHVGLTVLINKYDGVDLPNEACELLIIDGLPEVYGLLERVELSKVSGTETQVLRQVQKLEQGMGRGVRSSEDHCVVLLLGAKLTHRINNPLVRSKFTAATQSQLRVAREISRQYAGAPLAEIEDLFDLCLNADEDWVATNRKAVAHSSELDASYLDPAIPRLRRAFDLARQSKFEEACSEVEAAANEASDKHIKGYLKETLASYMQRVNPAKSQEILSSAISLNNRVTMPTEGIRYKKLDKAQTAQAKASVKFLSAFKDGNEIVLWMNSLLDDLRWDPERTDDFEDAIKAVGDLLGFGSDQPDRTTRRGPDNLWAVGGRDYFIIECKSGANSNLIAKKDCDQLTGHMQWFAQQYGNDCKGTPILIHPSHTFDQFSAPRADARIMDAARLEDLKTKLRQFAIALSADSAYRDEKRVSELLSHLDLTAAKFLAAFTKKFKIDR